jgi:hypothetical protein
MPLKMPGRLRNYATRCNSVPECAAQIPLEFSGTKDWMMRESQLINSWIREGEDRGLLRAKRADLLKVVRRLEDLVPESIRLAIEGTTDLDKLEKWLDAARDAKTMAELRQRMQLES